MFDWMLNMPPFPAPGRSSGHIASSLTVHLPVYAFFYVHPGTPSVCSASSPNCWLTSVPPYLHYAMFSVLLMLFCYQVHEFLLGTHACLLYTSDAADEEDSV